MNVYNHISDLANSIPLYIPLPSLSPPFPPPSIPLPILPHLKRSKTPPCSAITMKKRHLTGWLVYVPLPMVHFLHLYPFHLPSSYSFLFSCSTLFQPPLPPLTPPHLPRNSTTQTHISLPQPKAKPAITTAI